MRGGGLGTHKDEVLDGPGRSERELGLGIVLEFIGLDLREDSVGLKAVSLDFVPVANHAGNVEVDETLVEGEVEEDLGLDVFDSIAEYRLNEAEQYPDENVKDTEDHLRDGPLCVETGDELCAVCAGGLAAPPPLEVDQLVEHEEVVLGCGVEAGTLDEVEQVLEVRNHSGQFLNSVVLLGVANQHLFSAFVTRQVVEVTLHKYY